MNNNSLFKILLHRREISIEEILNYFDCNKEEMISELVVFLRLKFQKLEQEQSKTYPSYLFSIANRLEQIYGLLIKENKTILPFYRDYLKIQSRLITISKNYEINCSIDRNLEEFFLKIFYYQDIKEVKKMLEKNPDFMNQVHEGNKIFYYLLQSYYQSFTSTMKEYLYFKKLIEYILTSEMIDSNIKLEIIHNFEKESSNLLETILDEYPEYQYRMKEAGFLFGTCRKKLMKPLSNYTVKIRKERKIIDQKDTSIFTIDGEGTVLREDAVSVLEEQNHIKIRMYITDVTDYVHQNKKLQKITFSNWFEKISDEIFNLEYAVKHFSLDEGKIRNVMTYEFDFNQDNILENFTIYPATIKIFKNFSYDQVSSIIDRKGLTSDLKKDLELLSSVCNHLHESNKHKRKYHMLKELDRSLSGKEKNRKELYNNAGIIISELKIASGYILAKYFLEHQIPAIYRNNKFSITNRKIDDIKKICNEIDDVEQVKKQIKQTNIESYYSNVCEGHKGLNLECYMHMTTPARNYFALINSLIFKDICMNENTEQIKKYEQTVNQLIELQQEKDRYRKKIYTLEKLDS